MVPLLVTRPLSTPLGLRPLGTLRPLEQILGLLIEAGFTASDALADYDAAAELDEGITILLSGLSAHLAAPQVTQG